MSDDYQSRVLNQIDQYREDVNIHDLPEIFHVWSVQYLGQAIKQTFRVDSMAEVYVEVFLECARLAERRPAFVSLGCGDGSVEIEIARALWAKGLHEFDFICLDISPILIARFRENIPLELEQCFTLRAEDINREAIPIAFHAAMANHSLHHMVNLEDIFAAVFAGLHIHGVFVTCDMIGRNGHMRWPETKLFVDYFWPFLTLQQRRHQSLRREEKLFADYDCAGESFEGIRSQDILPAIFQAGFHPRQFLGYGGFIDVFLDRGFGHNFSVSDPDDVFLINRMGFLNELLLDVGLIKPTMMIATFVKNTVTEVSYRGRTAAGAVRPASADPAWLCSALSDFGNVKRDPDFVYSASRNTRLEAELRANEAVIADLRQSGMQLRAALEEKDSTIAALLRSTSWRLTAPIRAMRRLVAGR